jgi:sporulation protein YlmC with PRC-barrel domain
MLRTMKELQGYAIRATDGDLGHVKDVYFDDRQWVVRYLIVETGRWLASRKVLIAPFAIGQPDWTGKVLPISITKELVKAIPTSTRTGRSRGTKCATLGTMAAAAARQ